MVIEYLIKYQDAISILAGIGTFIASIVAVFTLVEVKKQRLAIYQPEVLIKSFLIAISKSPLLKESNELLEYKTLDFNDHSKNFDGTKFSVSTNYIVNNLGFGVASNVKCKWNFDYAKSIKLIEKVMPQRYSFSYYESLKTYFLNNMHNEEFQLSFNVNMEAVYIDYIAPISVEKHYHEHSIPRAITLCHYLYLLFVLGLNGRAGENFNHLDFSEYKFPTPKLEIEYFDINGKKYRRTFTFKVFAVTTQIDEKLDLTKEFGYLTFEVKN